MTQLCGQFIKSETESNIYAYANVFWNLRNQIISAVNSNLGLHKPILQRLRLHRL